MSALHNPRLFTSLHVLIYHTLQSVINKMYSEFRQWPEDKVASPVSDVFLRLMKYKR